MGVSWLIFAKSGLISAYLWVCAQYKGLLPFSAKARAGPNTVVSYMDATTSR